MTSNSLFRKESKKQERLDEQDVEDALLWNELRLTEDLSDSEACDLLKLGRRRAKKELVDLANRAKDKFYEIHKKHRDGIGVPQEYGSIRVRVMEHDWSVYVQWFQVLGRGPKFKPKMVSIKMPPGAMRANISIFPKPLHWEKEAIAEAEDTFERVRRASEHLKSTTRSINAFYTVMNVGSQRLDEREEAESEDYGSGF